MKSHLRIFCFVFLPQLLVLFAPHSLGQSAAPPAAHPTRTQSRILDGAEVFPTFQSAYSNLQSATIAPGTFRLARHAGTSYRLLKGELVLSASARGYQFYAARTVASHGTFGDFGIFRYEDSQWKLYSLDSSGNEFASGGHDIRTDGDTIALYTKGTNFEEFVVWQRISGEHVTEKYLARELSRMKALLERLLTKRASK